MEQLGLKGDDGHSEKLKKLLEKRGLKIDDFLNSIEYTLEPNYWDYLNVETLTSLQKPLTAFPDEMIFIVYHQISELYFKLCIHELELLTGNSRQYPNRPVADAAEWIKRLKRIDFYFNQLNSSMALMHKKGDIELLDRAEFTKFRLALFPASGFQTVQFRKIEIMLTDLENLQHKDYRIKSHDRNALYHNIYWKRGSLRSDEHNQPLLSADGNPLKPKALHDFEKRYDAELLELSEHYAEKNLYHFFRHQPTEIQQDETILMLLKKIDKRINREWKGSHYQAVKHHLDQPGNPAGNDELGGGGTNWKTYLPPENQAIIFFPGIYPIAEEHTGN
jgi:tryptophan 2,3-dioxygenase